MDKAELFEKQIEGCPVREVLDRLGDKWSVLIVLTLKGGTLRFSKLKKAIPDISQRMLTFTLRHLERDGLVNRKMYMTIPPKVEYSLTVMGKSFATKADTLVAWAHENRPKIDASRSSYDKTALSQS